MYAGFWRRSEGANQVNTLEAELNLKPFMGYEAYIKHHCGPQEEKPREEFNPISNFRKGDFLLLHLDDTNVYPI